MVRSEKNPIIKDNDAPYALEVKHKTFQILKR